MTRLRAVRFFRLSCGKETRNLFPAWNSPARTRRASTTSWDTDTIRTAITAAETGHLLLSSLHTIGAANTIDRIVDAFPAQQQGQIRVQLSMVLKAVVSQRLVPATDGSRLPVFEVMSVNPAIQNMIRDGRTHQIDNVIYGGSDKTMMCMDTELQRLFREGRITKDTALIYAANPEILAKRI